MAVDRLNHYTETRGVYRAFLESCRNLESAQERLWVETQGLIEGGTFWRSKRGGAANLRRLEDFDITQYSDYAEVIQRDYASDTSSFTGERVPYWITSSASTGQAKVFPATDAFINDHYLPSMDVLSHSLLRRFSNYVRKPGLNLVASRPALDSPAGISTGMVTYLINKRGPRALRNASAVPLSLYESAGTFEQWAPLYALASDLAFLRALSPSRVHRFLTNIVERRDDLLAFLEGRQVLPADLPPVTVTPERIRTIKRAFERRTVLLKELWPALQFVRVWKTSTCGLQLSLLAPHLTDDVEVVDTIYGMSEGSITVPVIRGRSGGPLLANTIIAEFIPVEREVNAGNLLPAWKVEAGKDYRVFLTTKMGLVRYRAGDIVRCTGHFEQAPILEMVERDGQELSLGGGVAILTEGHLVEVAKRINLETRGRWVFAPNAAGNGLVFYYDSADFDGAVLARKADEALRHVNPLYSSSSKVGTLVPIESKRLLPGHALWNSTTHAQSKDRVLMKYPI